ncbi:MAG: crossover junction endodeoxyribonuclease RuvC [Acidobacteriota bacterium]|jgi:crossover junction endodeoxyribonuclease RuvC|nr:crossover junction endodeoxyribonuclease RuvC [Acidobacteriota bacterium]MDT7809915.1 crossover junction endodeoxyribonuclease RuvC [Acidobacteriota bacterium]
MRILGIDPGSETTGWGVVEGDARRYKLVDFGTVKANPRERFAARLLKIAVGVEALIEKFRPDVCAVEEAFFAVNPKTALKLGHVRGVILLAAERAGVEIAEYAPRFIKQTVVGYGAAEKQQVQEMMRVLLRLKAAPTPFDASDALAVAVTHMHTVRPPEQAKTRTAPARAKLEALLVANPRRRAPR